MFLKKFCLWNFHHCHMYICLHWNDRYSFFPAIVVAFRLAQRIYLLWSFVDTLKCKNFRLEQTFCCICYVRLFVWLFVHSFHLALELVRNTRDCVSICVCVDWCALHKWNWNSCLEELIHNGEVMWLKVKNVWNTAI